MADSRVTVTFLPAGEDAVGQLCDAAAAWFETRLRDVNARHRHRTNTFVGNVLAGPPADFR